MSKKEDRLLAVSLDFSEMEEADNGETTFYGGVWRLNGEEAQAYGDDRSDNPYWDAQERVLKLCEEKWPASKKAFEKDDFRSQVLDAITEGDGRFDVVVERKGRNWPGKRPGPKSKHFTFEVRMQPSEADKAAKEVGSLLGDLLVNHLEENEDYLAFELSQSIATEKGCKGFETVRKGGEVYATEKARQIVVREAMSYVETVLPSFLSKALNVSEEDA